MPPVASSGSGPEPADPAPVRRRDLRRRPPTARFKAMAAAMAAALFVAGAAADYEVQRGDTLREIAAEHGTTIQAIVEANDIRNPDVIYVGQRLVIPGVSSGGSSGGGGDASAGSQQYVVERGDSLWKIARKFGVSVGAIASANSLSNVNLVFVGQKLTIPAGSGGGSGGSTAPSVTTHLVQAGDTLAGIARTYGTSVEAIREANGLLPGGTLYRGATLRLSGSTPVLSGGGSEPGRHTVVRGDSLARIASRYGTTVSAIARANSISNPNRIQIGADLEIPGGSAGWVCPVQGSRYINSWGFPRSGGRLHLATDLFAPRGTAVRAPVSGVLEPKTGSIGGNQFTLRGDDGFIYVGTHMDAFGATGRVRAGEVIGTVGSTGNAAGTSPHLHFEIHDSRGPFNPYPTLKKNGC